MILYRPVGPKEIERKIRAFTTPGESFRLLIFITLGIMAWVLPACTAVTPTSKPPEAAPATSTNTTNPPLPVNTISPTTISPTLTLSSTATLPPINTKKTATQASIIPGLIQVASLGKGSISPVFRSPDRKRVIFSGIDGKAHWYDSETGKEQGAVDADIIDAVISPDNRFAALTIIKGFMVIDLDTGSVVSDLPSVVLNYRSSPIFSPNMRFLALLNAVRTTRASYGHIEIIRLDGNGDPEPLPVLNENEERSMSDPVISPDSTLVTAGSSNQQLYIWDAKSGEIRYVLEAHTGDILGTAFSPDGKILVSSSKDGTLQVWDPYAGKLLRVISGFFDGPLRVSFTPDGMIQLTGQLFNPLTGEKQPHAQAPIPAPTPDPYELILHRQGYLTDEWVGSNPILFSPNGEMIAVGGRNILLWDIKSQELLTSLEVTGSIRVSGMAFSPDGTRLSASHDNGIQVWDIDTGQTLFERRKEPGAGTRNVYTPAFSPDGKQLAFGIGNRIEVWDMANWELRKTLQLAESKQFASQVAYSEDGDRVYSIINWNMGGQIWNLDTEKMITQVAFNEYHSGVFSASDLNPPYFVRNNTDQTKSWIDLWNLDTGQVKRLPVSTSENSPLTFSPDGTLFVSQGYPSQMLSIWETDTGKIIYTEFCDNLGQVAVSPSLDLLAVGNGGIVQLFDIAQVIDTAQEKVGDEP